VADSDVTGYQVRIWTGATAVRTVTVALAPAVDLPVQWTYTAAMQVADFGAAQPSLTWSVRQRGTYGWGIDTTLVSPEAAY
jgi:acetoacetate decarboxylase